MPRRDILSPEQRIDLFALPRDEGAVIRLNIQSQHDLPRVWLADMPPTQIMSAL